MGFARLQRAERTEQARDLFCGQVHRQPFHLMNGQAKIGYEARIGAQLCLDVCRGEIHGDKLEVRLGRRAFQRARFALGVGMVTSKEIEQVEIRCARMPAEAGCRTLLRDEATWRTPSSKLCVLWLRCRVSAPDSAPGSPAVSCPLQPAGGCPGGTSQIAKQQPS